MSPKLLYWYEQNTVGQIYTWMDRFCTYFGFEPAVVDTLGAFKGLPGQYPIKLESFDAAMAQFSDHQWVCLDPDGDTILDEYAHPDDSVIYAIGSNVTGFSRIVDELPGHTVRLRSPEVLWDYQVAQMLMYDRMLYKLGRRL